MKKLSHNRIQTRSHSSRGFTLVELLMAGVITAFVLGSLSMSISQLAQAKSTSKLRFNAFLRADAALNALRSDIVSVVRSDDLFYTRVLILDDTVRIGEEEFDRDEIVVFNTRLKALRSMEFNGEGFEYETQYRVTEDEYGSVLWQRRDAMPDEYPLGGGAATPLIEGVIGLLIQAYDGQAWHDEWDSDISGLPLAVSVTLVTSGYDRATEIYESPRGFLRTVMSMDRVLSPKDLFEIEEDEMFDELGEGEGGEEFDEFGNPIGLQPSFGGLGGNPGDIGRRYDDPSSIPSDQGTVRSIGVAVDRGPRSNNQTDTIDDWMPPE